MTSFPPLRRFLLVAAALLLAACESGPSPGPGPLTVTVLSPFGAEGAAVLTLRGPGIRGVAADGGWVFAEPSGGDSVSVVVVADPAGALTFRVEMADTLQRPTAAVVQVAGPDDALREELDRYTVEVVR